MITHFRSMGHYFGYPDCCIDFFELCCAEGAPPPKVLRVMVPGWLRSPISGYIPCPTCATKTDAELIAAVKHLRIAAP